MWPENSVVKNKYHVCHWPSQGPRPNPLASATYIIGYCANFILEHVQQRVDDISNNFWAHYLSFLHDQIINAMVFLNAQLCPTGWEYTLHSTSVQRLAWAAGDRNHAIRNAKSLPRQGQNPHHTRPHSLIWEVRHLFCYLLWIVFLHGLACTQHYN